MLEGMTWIRTIAWPEADGQLKEAYDWQAAALGSPAEFTILGSLYPAIVEERDSTTVIHPGISRFGCAPDAV